MKQLVRYFLFFVCAAFALIQCARFFPTDNNLTAASLPAGKIAGNRSNKSSQTRSSYSTADWLRLPGSEKPAFNLHFTEQAFPLNMMKYISHYQFLSYRYWSINESKIDTWQLFYNPYTNLTYTGLFGNRDSSLIANNPFDRKKQ
jgi:hypothetical protein